MKFQANCLLLAALVLLSSCGVSIKAPEPSMEKVATSTRFNSVVRINSSSGTCSASLIAQNAILTAAHCIEGVVKIFLSDSYAVYGKRAIRPPDYSTSRDRDIAVVEFMEPQPRLTKLPVMPIGTQVNAGDNVTLVGFGANAPNDMDGVGHQRWGANMVLYAGSFLEFQTPARLGNSAPFALFGPKNRAAPGPGDSGGPAIRYDDRGPHLVGVCHGGKVHGENVESLYVNLTHNRSLEFLRRVASEFSIDIQFY